MAEAAGRKAEEAKDAAGVKRATAAMYLLGSLATRLEIIMDAAQTVMESISEEKQTRIGSGYFVTWVTTYTVDDDEVVSDAAPRAVAEIKKDHFALVAADGNPAFDRDRIADFIFQI